MSINNLIRISGGAFRALDSAMNATAQNVANMETEGYSRRRVTLQSDSLSVQGLYAPPPGRRATGAGVSVQQYERLRDNLLQKSAWEARSGLGGFTEQHRVLSSVEGILGASGDSSLSNILDGFYDSWARLADEPNDPGIRLQLRSQAENVASTLNRFDASLSRFSSELNHELASALDTTNGILHEIAQLNERISLAQNQGAPDLSAEDERDRLVDQLAEALPVQVSTGGREAFTISVDGVTLVQGTNVRELSVDGAMGDVVIGNTGVPLPAASASQGRIGAIVESIHQTIPSLRSDLAALAQQIADDTNAAHRTGFGLDGSTGIDFFNFSAGPGDGFSIAVSDPVKADARVIAASAGDPADGFADSDVARAIARLGHGSASPSSTFIDIVSGVGGRVNRAMSEASAREGVVGHLVALEKGVSGVSLEEEMTNLIRFQQAYAASARVLNTAQDMMDTLLAL